MKYTYANQYGKLEIETVGPYQAVREVDTDLAERFSIDTAERIALITDNRRIQLCPARNRRDMYLMHHESISVVAPCRIISLSFDENVNAREEIEWRAYSATIV